MVLNQVEKRTILVGVTQIENMLCPSAEMPM